MPQTITEARAVEATPVAEKPGRFLVQLISPGWGSSGYYSEAVLKQAAKDKVFRAGTLMMVNHQTAQEMAERPEGDLRDVAAVLDEDARWDAQLGALVAEAPVYSGYRQMLTEMARDIGVSIRATAEVRQGEAEGRKGLIVDRLLEAISVDYVTRAGRGGKILAVMEAARAVREATSNDRRDQLQRALPANSFVRDFDPDRALVFFEQWDQATEKSMTWQQSFEVAEDDQSVTLTGDPIEVRVVTQFVPVTQQTATESPTPNSVPADPAGQPTTTESSRRMNMAQIDDQELQQLRESAGRVQALESERDAARAALAEANARQAATTRAREALATANLPAPAVDRIVAEATRTLPMTNGQLDLAAFDQQVTQAKEAEAAYLAAITPAGRVTGFGQSAPVEESGTPTRTTNPWGRNLAPVKGA